jgi:hypothetical protein
MRRRSCGRPCSGPSPCIGIRAPGRRCLPGGWSRSRTPSRAAFSARRWKKPSRGAWPGSGHKRRGAPNPAASFSSRRSTPSGSAVPAGIAAEAATAAPGGKAATSGSRCACPATRRGFTVRSPSASVARPGACLRRQPSAMPAGAGHSLNSECRWRRPLTPRPAGMRLSRPHRRSRRHCRRSRSRRPRRHGPGCRRHSPRSSRDR